ncbi:MAG TPA: zf-HC2 domain-containing protein [Blastocatellia bacterium]|nr:zf-HC2 domain-containing protein [Blastocatellia bacterium]
MNCRRVEKLIPLYVEGDLAPGIADRLTSHLDWCGRCNWLADEYKESQSWLRTSEPPEFDEAFLDNLKAGVLSRIEETSARPSLLASLVQQWSRKQVFALSAALLIIFGALVFYIYQVRTRANPSVLEAVEPPPNDDTITPNEPRLATKPGQATGAALSKARRGKSQATTKPRRGNATIAERTLEPPFMSQTRQLEESATTSAEPRNALPGSADDLPEMLRIEIQTSDPNIRIIWFAPKEVESPKSNQ